MTGERTTYSFEEVLKREGVILYTTRGVNMLPMLHEAKDLVVVEKLHGHPKPLDVVLYRRGSSYILHRVIRTDGECCLIRGDNTYESEYVRESDILGVLTSFGHRGKSIPVSSPWYLCYAKIWTAVYPLRALAVRSVRRFRRVLPRRCGGTKD